MIRKVLGKLVLTAVFTVNAVVPAATALAWPGLTGEPLPGYGPSRTEEACANEATAVALHGNFDPDNWQYNLPPDASAADVGKALMDNGYQNFYDPFHDGDSYKKVVDGRWYHYVVKPDGSIESHWDKSQPGSLRHMREAFRPWTRAPEGN